MRTLAYVFVFALFVASTGCNLSDPVTGIPPSNNGSNNGGTNNGTGGDDCDPPCVNGTCSAGVCMCDDGAMGADCSSCLSGFQDNDENGTCEPECGNDCGAHGTCDDSSGTVECTCDEGYTGESCSGCAAQFQDNDGDGECDEACGNPNADDCGEATCDDSSGDTECVCPDGGVFDEGSMTCAPTELPADAQFDDAPTPWTIVGNVDIDPLAPGDMDPGVAVFGVGATCDGGGLVQTYSLPTYSAVGPMKAVARYQVTEGCTGGCVPGNVGPGLVFDRRSYQYISASVDQVGGQSGWVSAQRCLGEAAYDGDIELGVVANNMPGSCGPYTQGLELVDHLEFVAAGNECPIPGEVRDGDFSAGNWLLEQAVGATSVVANGQLELTTTRRCATAAAVNGLSVPNDGQAYAIQFEHNSDRGFNFQILPDGNTNPGGALIDQPIAGTGATTPWAMCLPSWMNGTAAPIRFALYSGDGQCTTQNDQQTIIDNVQLVAAPNCAPSSGIVNGTMDVLSGAAWVEDTTPGGIARLTQEDDGNGDFFYRIRTAACERAAIYQTVFLGPGPNAPNTINFDYQYINVNNRNDVTLRLRSTHGVIDLMSLPETAARTSTFVCIPPQALSVPARLEFDAVFNQFCAGGLSNAVFEVDNVTLSLDPRCP